MYLSDHRLHTIVERGFTEYPIFRAVHLRTSVPNQRVARIPLYEGTSSDPSQDEYLGDVVVVLTGNPPPGTRVAVQFHIDQDDELTVDAQYPDHHTKKPMAYLETAMGGSAELGRRKGHTIETSPEGDGSAQAPPRTCP
jgi:molecular chaperone DnaK (HSP70)